MKDPANVSHISCEDSVVVCCLYGLGVGVFNLLKTLKIYEW
jgi:hypothetical protein